jgi:hypothetical protein
LEARTKPPGRGSPAVVIGAADPNFFELLEIRRVQLAAL